TQAKFLAQEQSRGVVARIGEVGLLRLAVGEAAGADGIGETEALQQLGIEVELATLPQAYAEERPGRPGLARLATARQAGVALERRRDRWIALDDERGLAVDLKAARTAIPGRVLFFLRFGDVAQMVVQRDAKAMVVVRRIVARRRDRKGEAG